MTQISKNWVTWLSRYEGTCFTGIDNRFDQIDRECRDSPWICLGDIKEIGLEFPFIYILESFRHSDVARSIGVPLNDKRETGINQTFSGQPDVEYTNQVETEH